MKKFGLYLLLSSILVLISTPAKSQSDLSTMIAPHLAQSALYNPANLPNNKFTISLPSLYFGASSSSVSIQNIIDSKNGSWINNLTTSNSLSTDVNIETFAFYAAIGKLKVGIHHGLRSSGSIYFPKQLPELIWFGNAKSIGKTMDLSPNINFSSHHELGLSASYEFGKLQLGARVKFLSGIGNLNTEKNKLSLTTSDDIYQLTLQSDYLINASGTINYYSIDSLEFNSKQFDFNKLFGKNNGLSFDLGENYKLSEKLQIGIGIHDLAATINWKENTTNLSTNGSFTYNGIALKDLIYSDTSYNFENLLDSVKNSFQLKTTNNTYKSSLSTRYFATAKYEISDKLSANGILFVESQSAKTITSFAVGMQYQLTKWLNFGANYAAKQNSPFNIGLNASIQLGPVQFFALTDNIIALSNPYNSRNATGRVGINLVIGKRN